MDLVAQKFLSNKLEQLQNHDYPSTSRVHRLRGLSNQYSLACFVKRDDELGFGICGTKFRKYRVLIPFLLENSVQEAVVIGGAFSNNVLSLSQLLIENGLQASLFLKGPEPSVACGNFLLTKLLNIQSRIRWIPSCDWPRVDELAHDYAASRVNAMVIPEGASVFPSFLGALSLPLDIARNALQLGIEFDHIYMDVGTGYSAAALALGLAFLQVPAACHFLLLADDEVIFMKQLHTLHNQFEQWLGTKCPFPINLQFARSTLCPSFGSTNALLFRFIIETAQTEGFFLDPIYSAKLFYHVKSQLETCALKGTILVIHSGGALSLSGFQQRLQQQISS